MPDRDDSGRFSIEQRVYLSGVFRGDCLVRKTGIGIRHGMPNSQIPASAVSGVTLDGNGWRRRRCVTRMGSEYEFLGYLPRPWQELVEMEEQNLCQITKAGIITRKSEDSPWRRRTWPREFQALRLSSVSPFCASAPWPCAAAADRITADFKCPAGPVARYLASRAFTAGLPDKTYRPAYALS